MFRKKNGASVFVEMRSPKHPHGFPVPTKNKPAASAERKKKEEINATVETHRLSRSRQPPAISASERAVTIIRAPYCGIGKISCRNVAAPWGESSLEIPLRTKTMARRMRAAEEALARTNVKRLRLHSAPISDWVFCSVAMLFTLGFSDRGCNLRWYAAVSYPNQTPISRRKIYHFLVQILGVSSWCRSLVRILGAEFWCSFLVQILGGRTAVTLCRRLSGD